MPHSLSGLQKEYLDYIRGYIKENECSPRLDEIAHAFSVRPPTAHKILRALQSKGFLYFGRDPKSGFFIRLIERAGSAEVVMEVPIAGKVNGIGEVTDFPQEHGHFVSAFIGVDPEKVFALMVTEDIPQASILAGDLVIFDQGKQPQPGDVCIAPIGKRFFLIKVAAKTMNKDYHDFKTAVFYPTPNDLVDPELKQLLNWYPLAYDDSTHDFFTKVTEEGNWPIGPIPSKYIVATALRLTRQLAW